MVKLMIIIFNDEQKLKNLLRKYKLSYNVMTYGTGTASVSLLEYLGLDEVRKSLYFSLIPSSLENNIFKELETKLKIKELGKGVAFTISLLSSSKFVSDSYANLKGEVEMEKDTNDYELVVTIVKEGYKDVVMQAAKKAGCTGGTVIEGRSLGSSRTVFMNLSIEPEKDIVLNIVTKDIAKSVMKNITKEAGVKTEARGLVLALPIDRVLGLQDIIK